MSTKSFTTRKAPSRRECLQSAIADCLRFGGDLVDRPLLEQAWLWPERAAPDADRRGLDPGDLATATRLPSVAAPAVAVRLGQLADGFTSVQRAQLPPAAVAIAPTGARCLARLGSAVRSIGPRLVLQIAGFNGVDTARARRHECLQ